MHRQPFCIGAVDHDSAGASGQIIQLLAVHADQLELLGVPTGDGSPVHGVGPDCDPNEASPVRRR